jgi:hypothetical protein
LFSFLARDLGSKVVKAKANVGGVRVREGVVGAISIGVSGVSVGGGQDLGIGISFPLLASVQVGAGVSGVTGGAWDGDVGSVDARGGLESGEAETVSSISSVSVGESGVEESWVSLSLGVDGGHKGEKNNLQQLEKNDERLGIFKQLMVS